MVITDIGNAGGGAVLRGKKKKFRLRHAELEVTCETSKWSAEQASDVGRLERTREA